MNINKFVASLVVEEKFLFSIIAVPSPWGTVQFISSLTRKMTKSFPLNKRETVKNVMVTQTPSGTNSRRGSFYFHRGGCIMECNSS